MHYISYWGGRNHISFVGDSRIRQLYFDFVSQLSTSEVKSVKAHSDLSYVDEKLRLQVVSPACQHVRQICKFSLSVNSFYWLLVYICTVFLLYFYLFIVCILFTYLYQLPFWRNKFFHSESNRVEYWAII